MILEKLEYCPLCEAGYATQYEYDFQTCNNCDPIPTIEEIEAGSFSTAQVAAMAKRIAELEAELSTLKAQREWVPVSERLPKSDVQVLGALRGESGRYNISRINYTNLAKDHDWEADGWELGNCWTVTHWMPLPPAPEGE